mmetsp:Transcript_14529/g.21427  ORF Transcript_14529/g.21427 Transcript_14529/m.21427 type:complete len:710 (-) Transcript_14529:57-2186(-)|eukprot:CAMPEP_0194213064 /NCGR_PEP_ID=MMETSP0156-20130528/13363_1 /TAXON_ID=33649 /ORGANISM="Thalassionema nitzschioides, Strain L26-B" /LENGTH=709 /DNA_ID=CAMNT_0038941009 /DNA_START=96 /DNA_END=2225 /DNA_ORIENTATION=+
METHTKESTRVPLSKRHRFHHQAAYYLTAFFLVALIAVSAFSQYSGNASGLGRLLENDDNAGDEQDVDFSSYSCNEILDLAPNNQQGLCDFAKTCNQGEGIFLSFTFCSGISYKVWTMILGPFLFIWLILLFRMLGSTAEDYFSPSLEMFSTKLGLPPRFAGVSLLALGNGAADVSATINAITTDPQNGYLLSLGALTGSCMFIGAVVASVVILAADGVPCRGALVRDVSALLITAIIVWSTISSGVIGHGTITLFSSFYIIYMVIVLIADVYHRAVVLPRLEAKRNEAEVARQRQASIRVNEAAGDAFNNIASTGEQGEETSGANTNQVPVPSEGVFSTFMTALSNYDNTTSPEDQQEGWGVESDDLVNERPVVLHGSNGVLTPERRQHHASNEDDADLSGGNYAVLEDGLDNICTESGSPARNWTSAWRDNLYELQMQLHDDWKEIFNDEDLPMYEKALLVFEFPFTVFRKLTVSIPCEGHYSRGTMAASLAISPIWFAFYLWSEREINLFWNPPYFFIHFAVCALIAVCVVRYAPSNDGVLSLYIATPIALYGFVIAATWIDWIADKLVLVLDFFGVVLHIPKSIMGLTVLAWGNSMADLSANVTMARKGLANMAMTACFAGPVFNILIGISFGFSSLLVETGEHEAAVVLTPSVRMGFIFMIINTVSLIFIGAFINNGRLPKSFGYFNLALYAVYIGLSLFVTFT